MAPLLSRAHFDEPFWARTQKPESFHPAYADLVESSSGYALRRTGQSVTPFLVPALDGSGRTNIACASGAVRFWFKPEWSSDSLTPGAGPGTCARLIELTVVGPNQALVVWSLCATPDGNALYLTGETDKGPADLLSARVQWQSGQWHLVVLNYGPNASTLFLDGELAAEGGGVQAVPPNVSVLSVGSTVTGNDPAGGGFDEVCAFSRALTVAQGIPYFQLYAPVMARGPISAEEEEAAKQWRAEHPAAPPAQPNSMLRMLSSTNCDTNGPVRLTNVVCVFNTNAGWTVTFDLVGGTLGLRYDIFTATNLAGTNAAASHWTWLERGPTCSTYQYTNQPSPNAFYVVGTPQDTDGDGLTDAFEMLVSKTDILVGENRIQSENAITGTTNWLLYNPVTVSPSHAWPTNGADTTPEVEGFASATSVNAGGSIDLYVDVRRTNDTNFTIEVFRLGWYGGAGGRKMTWTDSGQPTNTMILPSRKQPVPWMGHTNGLVDCLSGATNGSVNTNLIWQRTYTLAIPSNWVSGVYLARLTTGTNVTATTNAGKQSYIIFTVREDARSSDLLVQQSVTTWQAYNPWGGSSIYPYPNHLYCDNGVVPSTVDRQGGTVSFNRPYAAPTCGNEEGQLFFGAGAGDFLALVNQGATPGWEYNMVRWLERQGYDVTYCDDIDTHRGLPAGKVPRVFLSVGHDEYWSGNIRTNVEAMRDRGISLGFFCANTCYWQIHFDQTERVFSVNKQFDTDLWRRESGINYPEASIIGEQFIYINGWNDPNGNIRMPINLPSGTGLGGLHWAYDYSGLTNGQALPGLLGGEVDGCWESNSCNCIFAACPGSNIVRLADSVFSCSLGCGSDTAHSYMTMYATSNGAQVFATGSMQWNWGLDDFAMGDQLPWSATGRTPRWNPARVHAAAQQMTHNILRKFSARETAPVILTNVDAITSGTWTNLYGSEGYWIANTTPLTNLPSWAQVTITGAHIQVWGNPTNDPKALLKPGSTDRIASAWTTTNSQGSTFTIDLNLTNNSTHQIALYCADWFGTGTVLEKIEVFESSDTGFAHPLDVRSFQLPANGVYLVWKLTGHRVIRVTKPDAVSGNKAMVSAIFFGGGS